MSALDVGTHQHAWWQRDGATVTPRQAFVLSDYQGGGQRGTVITEHPVDAGKAGIHLRAGRLIDATSLAGILASFTAEADGWLPARLIYQSRSRFAWHVPGIIRRMAFTVGADRRELTVPWPHLVLVARADASLQVLALRHGGVPLPSDSVYHAPLMNLSDTGALCFGNATRPGFDPASVAAFEDALFNTRFTHVNHPGTFTARRLAREISDEMHLEIWQALQGHRLAEFPTALLREMRGVRGKQITLGEALSA